MLIAHCSCVMKPPPVSGAAFFFHARPLSRFRLRRLSLPQRRLLTYTQSMGTKVSADD